MKNYAKGSCQAPNGELDKMNVEKHLAGIEQPRVLVLSENAPFISFYAMNISFHAPNDLFARSVYRIFN